MIQHIDNSSEPTSIVMTNWDSGEGAEWEYFQYRRMSGDFLRVGFDNRSGDVSYVSSVDTEKMK